MRGDVWVITRLRGRTWGSAYGTQARQEGIHMSADFAADQNAWGVVPAPLAPTDGAPPYADANEAIQQVLEAVKRNLPAVFAPPKKKAKKGLAFVLPWGTMAVVIEKTRVGRERWEKAGVQLDVSLTARVPAVEKLVGVDGDEARPLLKGGMLAPGRGPQYWQLETFGVAGMAYVIARVMNGYHELVTAGPAVLGALFAAQEKLAAHPAIEPWYSKVPKLFDERTNERDCRPSTRLGTLDLAAAACFAAAEEKAAARACLDAFRAGKYNQDLRGAEANSIMFELTGNQRADALDAIAAIVN